MYPCKRSPQLGLLTVYPPPSIQLFPLNWQLSTWPRGGARMYRGQNFIFVAMRKPSSLLDKVFHLLFYCCNTLRPSQLIKERVYLGLTISEGYSPRLRSKGMVAGAAKSLHLDAQIRGKERTWHTENGLNLLKPPSLPPGTYFL